MRMGNETLRILVTYDGSSAGSHSIIDPFICLASKEAGVGLGLYHANSKARNDHHEAEVRSETTPGPR